MEAEIRKYYTKYSSYVKASRAFRLLKAFTRFNRVQLGRGLWEALEWLEYELNERSSDSLETSLIEVSTSNLPGSYLPPAEWSVHNAWFEISGGERLDIEIAPTLVAAHSPPSEGIVKGKAILIRDPLDPREYERAKGRVAVVTGVSLSIAYVMAAEAGAVAVAYYRRDLPGDATPYSGLFLPVGLIKKYGIPAVSLPYSLAVRSNGRDVALLVDSDLNEATKVPILEATVIGKDSRECESEVAAVAHACHPEPGANDNGSGVAASVEAFLALAEAADSGVPLGCSAKLYLLPEFTGSILVASRRKKPAFVANLDMVGGREGDVGGNWFYAPPAPLITSETAQAFTATRLAYHSEGLDIELKQFAAGSDHVPFLYSGSTSFMINQWPDKYYHSDYDDVDRISKRNLRAASASLASMIAYTSSHNRPNRLAARIFAERYVMKVSESHYLNGDLKALALAQTTLKAALGLEFRASQHAEGLWEPWMRDAYPKLREYPLMSPSQLVYIDFDGALRIAEILRGKNGGHLNLDVYTSAFIEPQLLSDGSRSLAYIIEIISAEHGSSAAKLVPETLKILEEAGIMEIA